MPIIRFVCLSGRFRYFFPFEVHHFVFTLNRPTLDDCACSRGFVRVVEMGSWGTRPFRCEGAFFRNFLRGTAVGVRPASVSQRVVFVFLFLLLRAILVFLTGVHRARCGGVSVWLRVGGGGGIATSTCDRSLGEIFVEGSGGLFGRVRLVGWGLLVVKEVALWRVRRDVFDSACPVRGVAVKIMVFHGFRRLLRVGV